MQEIPFARVRLPYPIMEGRELDQISLNNFLLNVKLTKFLNCLVVTRLLTFSTKIKIQISKQEMVYLRVLVKWFF